jgi:hypothetical protein
MIPITFGCGKIKPTRGLGHYSKTMEKERLKRVPIKIDNPVIIFSYPLDSL